MDSRMVTRRLAPVVFVALCLGLSGLVLRRQIAAHPIPHDTFQPGQEDVGQMPGDPGLFMDRKRWHIAHGAEQKAAQATVLSQLAAFRTGDADKAWFYQSHGLRANFHSPQEFLSMIVGHYPEFGHSRSAMFGPFWSDMTGRNIGVIVTVRGENGHLARGFYRMIQEDGGYKVSGVGGGMRIPEPLHVPVPLHPPAP